jgi:hypothetical protein
VLNEKGGAKFRALKIFFERSETAMPGNFAMPSGLMAKEGIHSSAKATHSKAAF